MWWVLAVVAVAALLSAYLGWTARRVERVHVRVQSAERALAAHLLRRAAAAAVVAEHADATELYAAARLALDAEPDEREAAENSLTRQLQALPFAALAQASLEQAALTRSALEQVALAQSALPFAAFAQSVLPPAVPPSRSDLEGADRARSDLAGAADLERPAGPPATLASVALAEPAMRALIATSRRAVLARQVHTDLVRDALTARGRPLVRMTGMARRYPQPAYFDIAEPTLPEVSIPRPATAPPIESAVAVEVA
jgi:hypothetical protein